MGAAAQMAIMQQMQQQRAAAMYAPQAAEGAPRMGAPAPTPSLSKERQTGRLKKFFEEKGFGFIEYESGDSRDVFVHQGQIRNGTKEQLVEGMTLSFELESDGNGKLKATNVLIEDQ